jgi:hypothetical protein
LISKSRHQGSVTIGCRFEKVREDINDVAIVVDIPEQATALSRIENSFEEERQWMTWKKGRKDLP